MNIWRRAFVLHTKPYSETSLLVYFFVENVGKVTAIAKGAKRKRSLMKGALQPFTPLIIQYSDGREMKTLRHVEAISLTLPLVATSLYSAFYLNELILRVLIGETDTQDLFEHYLQSLQQLAQQVSAEKILRNFELELLNCLGYCVDFFRCFDSGNLIQPDHYYHYQPEKGFLQCELQTRGCFSGEQVLSIGAREFNDVTILKAAKQFTRQALRPYVGDKPFKSRELFLMI